MHTPLTFHRAVSACLLCVMLLTSTAPAWMGLSASAANNDSTSLILLCTADGYQYVTQAEYNRLLSEGDAPQTTRPHCPLCITSASMADIPVGDAAYALPMLYGQHQQHAYNSGSACKAMLPPHACQPRAPPTSA